MAREMACWVDYVETPVVEIIERVVKWAEWFPVAGTVQRQLVDVGLVGQEKLLCESIFKRILNELQRSRSDNIICIRELVRIACVIVVNVTFNHKSTLSGSTLPAT